MTSKQAAEDVDGSKYKEDEVEYEVDEDAAKDDKDDKDAGGPQEW